MSNYSELANRVRDDMNAIRIALLFAGLLLNGAATCAAMGQDQISWMTDLEEAQRIANRDGKFLLIHFWSERCGPCKKLDTFVFAHPSVARAIHEHYIPVKINTDEQRGIAASYKIDRIPQDVIVMPNGEIVTKQVSPSKANQYIAMVQEHAPAASRNSNPRPFADSRVAGFQSMRDSVPVVPASDIDPRNRPELGMSQAPTMNYSDRPTPTDRAARLASHQTNVNRSSYDLPIRSAGNNETAPTSSAASMSLSDQIPQTNPYVRQPSTRQPQSQAPQSQSTQSQSPQTQLSRPPTAAFDSTSQRPQTPQTSPPVSTAATRQPASPPQDSSSQARSNGSGLQLPPSGQPGTSERPNQTTRNATNAFTQDPVLDLNSNQPLAPSFNNRPSDEELASNDESGNRFQSPANFRQLPSHSTRAGINSPAAVDGSPLKQQPVSQPTDDLRKPGAEDSTSQPSLKLPSQRPTDNDAAMKAQRQAEDVHDAPGEDQIVRREDPASQTSPESKPDLASAPGMPPIGMEGYCPISLFEMRAWKKGSSEFGCIHRGKLYLFTSANNRDRFLQYPDRFAPMLSGYDPVVFASERRLVPGKRQHGLFSGGRIYMFSSEETLAQFRQDVDRFTYLSMDAMGLNNQQTAGQPQQPPRR